MVDKLLLEWKQQPYVALKASESEVRDRMLQAFVADLMVEDELNKEVDEFLAKYEKQFSSGQLDRHKMFQMVKNQLIKERKLVI